MRTINASRSCARRHTSTPARPSVRPSPRVVEEFWVMIRVTGYPPPLATFGLSVSPPPLQCAMNKQGERLECSGPD